MAPIMAHRRVCHNLVDFGKRWPPTCDATQIALRSRQAWLVAYLSRWQSRTRVDPPSDNITRCASVRETRDGPSIVGRLQVLVEHFTDDAPSPVEIAAPDHEKASPHPRGIRALRAADPGRTAERGRKVSFPER